MGDQGSKRGTIKSNEEILANGGCKIANTVHENGHEWHPILPSHGEQKCVKCRCKVCILQLLFLIHRATFKNNLQYLMKNFLTIFRIQPLNAIVNVVLDQRAIKVRHEIV